MAPKKDKVPPPSSKPAKSGGGKQKKKINGSLARRAIRELMAKGVIRMVAAHSSQQIYTRATNT
uniref:40S ribosomal protein S25 n=1 Tax=Brassica oleracea var. oleracea TaxID=109376 RepID=A0A0D3A0W7_BRAOL